MAPGGVIGGGVGARYAGSTVTASTRADGLDIDRHISEPEAA
jgi:hypothetical protein